ncbi:hypothetical protein PG985_011053 [Apiospora marii]|uniref:Tautomerase cis-CaaD-like domain-containing protein n=1 Tax=Apiospora marii TaxID=335849 RepID=A0ABR1SSJ9_9PEZI
MLGRDAADHDAIMLHSKLIMTVDDAALTVARAEWDKLTAKIKEFARSVGEKSEFVYINYVDLSQDPPGSYGAASVR